MAMFHQPKHRVPVEPEACARCRARMGASLVDYMIAPGGEQGSPLPRREWLCDACRAILQRGADQN